ncbi:hypothetical protein ABK040_007167 [Willaertia magna]
MMHKHLSIILLLLISLCFIHSLPDDSLLSYFYGSEIITPVTDKIPKPIPLSCVNQQKSWITATILSLVLGGFGADRFYLGFISNGFLKLILGCLVLSFTCLRCCFSFSIDASTLNGKRKVTWLFFNGSVVFISFLQFALWLMDFILIMGNLIRDSNQCPMTYN